LFLPGGFLFQEGEHMARIVSIVLGAVSQPSDPAVYPNAPAVFISARGVSAISC